MAVQCFHALILLFCIPRNVISFVPPRLSTLAFKKSSTSFSLPSTLEPTSEASVQSPATASHSVESSDNVHTLTINLGASDQRPITIETGKIGRQAAGSVTLTRGETVLYTTVARDSQPKPGLDFLPLSVEHCERFSSAGTTSGSFNRRDGRPAEHEILACRLIDRPIRPLVDKNWRRETQILSWVLSYDGVSSCDPLAITNAGAAMWISDVPMKKPVAAAMVGYVNEEFILNPSVKDMEKSSLNLIIAGTKDAVMMIEGAADFLPESVMMDAVSFGHLGVKAICEGLEDLGRAVNKEKLGTTDDLPDVEKLQGIVDGMMAEKVEEIYNRHVSKDELSEETSKMSKFLTAELEEQYPEQKSFILAAFKDLLSRKMFSKAKDTLTRVDGRKVDEVRPISIQTSMLPRVHGSALFTRGQTQAIATATLGDSGMKQKLDKLDGMVEKRFYLQYTFPPSCVGETGRVGMPGRREVGHGNLAERALIPTLPTEEEFPYTIRVESLITESHGSSSMASVCGGSLALMDAGVPVKHPIAGIAMGMLVDDKAAVSDDNAVILSDITGTEDAFGTMDFKVAGNKEGITTFQLDIKCEGLTLSTMARALEQARLGRLHILEQMDLELSEHRSELPPTVPKIATFNIPEGNIGKVIGPGGKQIRAIIEDFQLSNMNVGETGSIQLTAMNATMLQSAQEFVEKLIADSASSGRGGRERKPREPKAKYVGPPAEEGKIYKGKVTGIHDFGVFLEILPGAEDGSTPGLEGLCHISQLHTERVRNCEGFVNNLNLDEFEVKFTGLNQKGQLQLSRKAAIQESRGGPRTAQRPQMSREPMPQAEVDVIAQAIQGVKEIE